MRHKQEVCQRNHNNWVVDPRSGNRRCNTCHQDRNKRRDRRTKIIAWAAGTSKPQSECTFTYDEIMSARSA